MAARLPAGHHEDIHPGHDLIHRMLLGPDQCARRDAVHFSHIHHDLRGHPQRVHNEFDGILERDLH